ncbi:unnamed protein product [Chironomus riparius]|uniref:Uncharacterized protein n=1 Tax=Chironomus riparius TaxID=315576 RepID=A0A9N9S2K8_9DIPT|nr:unnamed protein product [Chironomus riparius]
MLRAVLKILAYLSILTSTRTSSSYLEPQSLVSYRRANADAVATGGAIAPSSIDVDIGIPANVQQFSDLSPDTIDGADVYDVQWRASNSPYFMPRLVNANSMLYTQLSSNNNKNINNNNNNNFNNNLNNNNNNNLNSNSNNNNNNNRRGSKKSRKSKKQQQESRINSSSSKQFYETHSKRRNSFSSTSDIDDTNDQSSSVPSSSLIDIQNHSNNNNLTSATTAKINNFTSNEYPSAQVDGKLERELQELFGIEGARKYQEYQLQQQIMSEQFGKIPEKNDNLKETQRKRDGGLGAAEEMQDVSGAMINQMMSRTTRRQREYDVPLIQCPPATDGMERFACPTPDRQGRYRCIDDHVLCDGFIDCPEGADEDRQACMFYKTTKAHLDVLADALLRWARGR